MSEINPVAIAQQLAQLYVQGRRTQVDTQSQQLQARIAGLDRLQAGMRAFQSALTALSGRQGMAAKEVSLSSSAFAAASLSTSTTALAGSTSLFIERIATAQQTSFVFPVPVPASGAGALAINLADGSTFTVDLEAADGDGDGILSPVEVARAINGASGNASRVAGMVMTVGGVSQLVLSSGQTGAGAAFGLDTANVGDTALRNALGQGLALTAAQDAVVWVGAKDTGLRVQQGSNTFTAIQGVSVQLQAAMAATDPPLVLKVGDSAAGTEANMRSFVDAYNALGKVLDELTASGDPMRKKAAGAYANDAGLRALRRQLDGMLRQPIGGDTVLDFGVMASREGGLTLNAERLHRKLAADPTALDTFFGKTSLTEPSGLLGALGSHLPTWLAASGGQIGLRRDGLQRAQAGLTREQTRIDALYEQAHARHLKEFSALQTLQHQMNQTSGALASLPVLSFGKS
jgi:flagellar hook-associated protein 2